MLKSCNNLCRGRDARARDEGSAGLRPCMNGHAGGCCRVLKGSSRGSRLSMACSGPRCPASRNMNSAFRGGSGPLERQPCRMSQPGARRRSMRAWRSTLLRPRRPIDRQQPEQRGAGVGASEEGQEAVPHPGALRRSPGAGQCRDGVGTADLRPRQSGHPPSRRMKDRLPAQERSRLSAKLSADSIASLTSSSGILSSSACWTRVAESRT